MKLLTQQPKKVSLKIFRLTLILTTCFYTSSSYAQERISTSPQRKGFVFGVAMGGGSLYTTDQGVPSQNYSRMSLLNLKLGYLINPNNAICFHVPSGGHQENGETRAFEAMLLTGQHWFGNRLWSSAGFGLAMDMPSLFDVENDDPRMYFGPAIGVTVGYELYMNGRFAIDIQARYLYGNYEVENVQRQNSAIDLMLGFNLY